MLIPYLLGLEILLIRALEDFLEDVLESAIVRLQDGVLGAHVQRQLLLECQFETRVREASNRLVGVVLRLRHASGAVEFVDGCALLFAVLGCEDHLELTTSRRNHAVLGSILISKGVTADNDGVLPAGHEARDAGNDNGFAWDVLHQLAALETR